MRLRKVFLWMLFAAFFLWLHFWLRFFFDSPANSGGVCNQGGAFGVPLPVWFVIAVSLVGGIFLAAFRWRENISPSEWPWILILIGGSGNLLERMLFGCIMDYMVLPGFSFFPVFNLADVLLTVGVISVLMENVKIKMKNDRVK